MTEVNIADIQKIKETKAKRQPKKKLHPVNNPPRVIQQQEHQQEFNNISSNNFFDGMVPQELSGGLKNICLLGMSLPIQKHKQKRLLSNLRESRYIDNYLNKYLTIDMISTLNDHNKMLCVYAMNYLDAFVTHDTTGTLHPDNKKNNVPLPDNPI